jgi:hypothetical protein
MVADCQPRRGWAGLALAAIARSLTCRIAHARGAAASGNAAANRGRPRSGIGGRFCEHLLGCSVPARPRRAGPMRKSHPIGFAGGPVFLGDARGHCFIPFRQVDQVLAQLLVGDPTRPAAVICCLCS